MVCTGLLLGPKPVDSLVPPHPSALLLARREPRFVTRGCALPAFAFRLQGLRPRQMGVRAFGVAGV